MSSPSSVNKEANKEMNKEELTRARQSQDTTTKDKEEEDRSSFKEPYSQIYDHPYVQSLLNSQSFKRVEPLLHKHDSTKNKKLLTGSTLSGPAMIAPNPLIFSQVEHDDNSSSLQYNELVCIYYLGDRLCGHPGIIHGGLLATLLDESLCRCAFPLFEKKLGVTASLKVDYLRPCLEQQFVVLKAKVDTYHHKRKILVAGHIETLPTDGTESGVKLCEAKCLVVEPKSIDL